ncbi:MAG: calcium/sodium antiporter [Alphaproteobacteria bacterium]
MADLPFSIGMILVGIVVLAFGGDLFVRGAVGLARRMRISPLLTGIVLVGFGTSMPELVTSLNAALQGSPGIAVGNVVGSNIANILLVLGLVAVLHPVIAEPESFARDAPMLALTAAGLAVFAMLGAYGRVAGLIFLTLLAVYLFASYRAARCSGDAQSRVQTDQADLATPAPHGLALLLTFTGLGLAGVIGGAAMMVDGSISVAGKMGISETIVGLTVIAVGTSLPEVATSVAAALRRQTDLAFGNVLGSNIFNVVGILGVTSLVTPLRVPAEVVTYDLWIVLGVTGLLLVFAFTKARITRREGLVFLGLYGAYVLFIVLRALP